VRSLIPVLVALATFSACTQEETLGPRAVVRSILEQQVIPDNNAFSAAAREQEDAVKALCTSPDTKGLEAARDSFRNLALSWSRIEWLSFGPAREGNRRETLFFWPDNRGRGLRQIEELAASTDARQFETAAFAGKSVAVKGMPALEYVLFGVGADSLTTSGSVRCAYAVAIAASVQSTARDLANAWSAKNGYRDVMLAAGPENAQYRNHKEALQKLLTAAGEQIQIVRDLKLKPLLLEKNGAPTPISPPFSDAGIPFDAISANVDSASAVFLKHASRLLSEESAYRAESLQFEVDTARNVLAEIGKQKLPAAQVAADAASRQRLTYLLVPLDGAHSLMATVYPPALGLVMGFNSLDGD
jgi:hypothetical protein